MGRRYIYILLHGVVVSSPAASITRATAEGSCFRRFFFSTRDISQGRRDFSGLGEISMLCAYDPNESPKNFVRRRLVLLSSRPLSGPDGIRFVPFVSDGKIRKAYFYIDGQYYRTIPTRVRWRTAFFYHTLFVSFNRRKFVKVSYFGLGYVFLRYKFFFIGKIPDINENDYFFFLIEQVLNLHNTSFL